jgi:hypothetical protein
MVMFLGMGTLAQATLTDRGADTLGNHLIYDTDLNITWYDYTSSYATWYNQMFWAENLTVTMADGRSFTDWRLPTTPGTIDGYTNQGEMGHLCYDELSNAAGSNNVSFTNLQYYYYWSGSDFPLNTYFAWRFLFDGSQGLSGKGSTFFALAVRSGDSAAVPEPMSVMLAAGGLISLLGIRRGRRRRA